MLAEGEVKIIRKKTEENEKEGREDGSVVWVLGLGIVAILHMGFSCIMLYPAAGINIYHLYACIHMVASTGIKL